jgi:DNA polymerase IV
VNVGISTNKLLAKMASDFKKPDMIHTLYKEEIKKKMWPLSVDELFMVGRKTVPKLNNLNIFTIGDLAKYDISILKEKFKSSGVLMWNYANGIDNSKVKSESSCNKVISNSVTLTHDITTREEAHNVLYQLVEGTSARLRKLKKCCYVISVTIRDSEFNDYSHGRKLNNAVDSTKEIGRTVCKLFDDSWKGESIRLLGIALSQLTEEQIEQISLFDDGYNSIKKQKALDTTIDSIRNKYGEDAVLKFSQLTKNKKS